MVKITYMTPTFWKKNWEGQRRFVKGCELANMKIREAPDEVTKRAHFDIS